MQNQLVVTANDLSKWENFPKGLRVILLDGGDGISAAETRSKLESLDYIVTTFSDDSEALSAVYNSPESFHIAIVEMNTSIGDESFKFLEAAKDHLPTIMISNDHCITTTMKCIALGAVEFLQKPLSLEKLKNIWQHVVHKAFNDGGASVSGSLKPVKDSVASMLHLDTDDMASDEKDPAPSTPQLLDQEKINCSVEDVNSPTEKENDIGESKSADNTNHDDNEIVGKGDGEKEEEEEGQTGGDSVNCHKKKNENKRNNKPSRNKNLSGNKTSRKKVDWTQELHEKFVQAVEELGIDHAVPSKILELMKVDGLTRHNIASHFQKFKMHKRNILPKEDHNHRLIQFRQQQRPVMAYPVWGLPGVHHPGSIPPVWPPPPPLPTSGQLPPWHWKPPYPTVNGNVWGYPVGPPVTGTLSSPPVTGTLSSPPVTGRLNSPPVTGTFSIPPETPLDEELIDKVVKEAISKPWLPLPLGLKPPSAETVLAELSSQGISAVPSSPSS